MAKALDGREIVKVKLIPDFFQKAQPGPAHVCIHSSMPTQQSMSKDTEICPSTSQPGLVRCRSPCQTEGELLEVAVLCTLKN